MKKILLLLTVFASTSALAMHYECRVTAKVDQTRFYTKSEIEKWMFSLNITDSALPRLSRCSLSTISNKVTCDTHTVDKVVFDENINAKKFYHFGSQFDVQLFKDLSFVENNGRGGISYGKCLKK